MRIIVFGAGGFVGGCVCEELSERGEIDQIACVRKWASAVRLARRGIELRQVDLENTSDFPDVLAGADIVVNASMPPTSREADLATSLFQASVKAGVRRFVQFSSAAVYGNRTGTVDESAPPTPVDDYSRGKAEMERRLVEAAKECGTQLFILRPSIVYGPFSAAWTVRYVERVLKGRWRGLGRLGDGTCNLVHGSDVARAVFTAATREVGPGPYILNVNSRDAVTWNDYIEHLGEALGIAGRRVPNGTLFRGKAIAAEAMRLGGGLSWIRSLYRRSHGTVKSAMASAQGVTKLYPDLVELNILSRKVHYSSERCARVLGFTASIGIQEGIRQSVAWCRVHGIS